MKYFCAPPLFAALCCLPIMSAFFDAAKNNDHAIVLLHGFLGWGRGEMLGIPHWGGLLYDAQEDLRNQGHKVYTAEVGPISSNWDRACEFYAFIKGGTVDYGIKHSTFHKHNRYGRTFPGLYNDWGTGGTSIKKIHIVSHSMGGPTARLVAHLLANGDPDQGSSPLFSGGKAAWVASVTTIASPHDGTTLATTLENLIPIVKDLAAGLGALFGVTPNTGISGIFDFQLEHFGFAAQPGEKFREYLDRAFMSSIFAKDAKDHALWDLRPEGAKELNLYCKTVPSIYYLSYTTEATYRAWFTGHHLPETFMLVVLWPFSSFMGKYTQNTDITVNSNWWENDGVVNSNSMDGPTLDSKI